MLSLPSWKDTHPDQLISNCELECGPLFAALVDSDPNGAQPGVVVFGIVRNKETIQCIWS